MNVNIDAEKLEKAIIDQAVDELMGTRDFHELITKEITRRAEDAISKGLHQRIEVAINDVMKKALDSEIHPVNTWGEREGEPTTIRGALHDRAKAFWSELVDKEGKKTTHSSLGKPRYEYVLSVIAAKEFDAQIKQNIINIAGAIKDAVRDDFRAQIDTQLNALFKVTSMGDKGARKS